MYKSVLLFVSLVLIISCRSKQTILSFEDTYECNGVYQYGIDKSIPAQYYISEKIPIDYDSFSIEYDLKAYEYRDQWPIIVGVLYRVIGLKFSKEGKAVLTLNNNEDGYNTGFNYNLNEWYKVKFDYRKGRIKVKINNDLILKVKDTLNKPKNEEKLEITSCNYSNAECFKGEIKNIKVVNLN